MCILYILEKTTIYFSATAMWRLFEGGYYSKYRRRGYYLFQLYRNAATIRGRLLFEVQTSRLLFISALPQCSDYSRAATIRRGYYLFQLYRNAATIRGRLLFKVQTSRLLFISALPQCGDYSRAATIRSTDIAATIYFSSTAMQRLFEGGYYSKYRRRGYYLFQLYRNTATIRGRLLFEVQTSRLLFISALPQCSDYSRAATIRRGYYLFQLYRNAATIRVWLLLKVQTSRLLVISALPQCSDYSRAATIRRGYYLFQLYRNAATIRGRLLFKVQTSRLLFISALPQCGDYSRAANTRGTDVTATIYFSATAMWCLFEGGYYSKYRRRGYYLFQLYRNAATIRVRLLLKVQTSRLLFISALPQCSDYSRAATIRRGYYLFQLYRNAATIRGRLLFKVQTSRLLFISALPQCSDYSRAATIRSTDVAASIYFSSTAMRRLFEGGYYLFQLYRNAATIRGRLLFISALPQCGDYWRVANIRGRLLFEEIRYLCFFLDIKYFQRYIYHRKNILRKRTLYDLGLGFIHQVLPMTRGGLIIVHTVK